MSCCDKKEEAKTATCTCGPDCNCNPCVPGSSCGCACGQACTCNPCVSGSGCCGATKTSGECGCGSNCTCNPCVPGSSCGSKMSRAAGCGCGAFCNCTVCIPGMSCVAKKAEVGSPAPNFKLEAVMPGGQFGEVSLSDYRGKWVVLFFYPLDFTFVCPTEICAFSDAASEFQALNCELLACSVDSKFSHLAWTQKPRTQGGLGPMNIPMLADLTKSCASSYGVLMKEGIALRGLFLIDPKGVVRQITINDLPVGRDVGEVKRLLTAFQFTDEHGEVCPAGWRPGKKTMKADPEGSQEYFQDANA